MNKCIAVYVRVSGKRQDTRSQFPDLKRWVEGFSGDQKVRWYQDEASGKNMDRPGWQELEEDMYAGNISKIVTWRLDRLGRTAAGLTSLFEELQRLGVGFESIRDRVDLGTASGRLMAHILASVAAYENEIRAERIRAGQAAAHAQGKRWGGSKRGVRKKVSEEQMRVIRQLKDEGIPVTRIARSVGLSRPTIYSVLKPF